MFTLIWTTLIFSLKAFNTYADASDLGLPFCSQGFCFTVNDGDIIAMAGLCTVIPCSFTTGSGFTPKSIVWFKCEPSRRCVDSEIVFHTNHRKVRVEYLGRVVLLNPDVTQGNCSIRINNLTASDSGSYQLRVNGLTNGLTDGFVFTKKVYISVKEVNHKPAVSIPQLTEGEQATLICTPPNLCSVFPPKITWIWRLKEGTEFNVTGNMTASSETVNLTAVTRGPISALTFNSSAKQHNTKITCRVSFPGEITTEDTLTLNVNYKRKLDITGYTTVKEGDTLNLTCNVESFPQSLVVWTKQSESGIYLQNNTGSASLLMSNVTADDSGQYVCTATHLGESVSAHVDVKVTYKRKLDITGYTTVKEGDTLNLTCNVESFPQSLVVWTKQSESGIYLQNNTGSASLLMSNVTADDSGQYVCTATHLGESVSAHVDVKVTWFSKILKASGCMLQSELLTCVCITEGFPLPTITWPLLKDHTEYSVIKMVTNHTVNTTVTISLNKHQYIGVECFSSHENGEAKENLTVQLDFSVKEGFHSKTVLETVVSLEVIVAFLIGVLLSAIIYCLALKCNRKTRNSGNVDETLKMIPQDDPVTIIIQKCNIDNDQAAQIDQIQEQDEAENGTVAVGKSALDVSSDPRDVQYANIDFSNMKRRTPTQEGESTSTEYTEIKIGTKEQGKGDSKQENEILSGNDQDLMLKHNGMKKCITEEQGEVDAVYSTVAYVLQ